MWLYLPLSVCGLQLSRMAVRICGKLVSVLSFIVFFLLDFLDVVFCIIYHYLDKWFEGKPSTCYCQNKTQQGEKTTDNDEYDEGELSDTLYTRKNFFRDMRFFKRTWKREDSKRRNRTEGRRVIKSSWSDCGCESCVSWTKNVDEKLHIVLREPSQMCNEICKRKPIETVIFVHGFLSSSSFWTHSVFPNLSQSVTSNYRLIAIDLLGFGGSPKPKDCLYTLQDHIETIEKSVLQPFSLTSFHLVSHSMGCIIALALASKYSNSVKSITLVAPPYFAHPKEGASLNAFKKFAKRKLWPPLAFGSSFMSWYEHLGRCFCFLFCRNHRVWEAIIKLVTRKRVLPFTVVDMTRHTHHSAWHSMHNVICGGAKFLDDYLDDLAKAEVRVCVIHGDQDQVVPLDCCKNVKMKVPHAKVDVVRNADHTTVIFGREKEFSQKLEHVWATISVDGIGQSSLNKFYGF